MQPRRSVLYMPGSNARALEKARSLPADSLILDLEDAVAPEQKAAARSQVLAALAAGGYGHRECVVRINGLDSEWGQADLEQLAGSPARALCLPKVETPEQIRQAAEALDAAGTDQQLWIMLETPRGVLAAETLCAASPRVAVVVLGTSDLAKELRLPPSPDRIGLLASLGHCVLAARAHGLDIIDGVHLDLQDSDGLEASCRQGRELGFDGKSLIHPGQIAAANAAFSPAADELERALAIETAWQQARARGEAVVVVAGRLVENLHVAEARRLLALAEAIRQRGAAIS